MSGKHSDNICPLCSELIDIYAIGACDHPVCHKCSVRMRVLHEQMYCAICRSDLGKVLFVTKPDCKYDRINTHRFQVNRRFKIFFENEGVELAYFSLLEHSCRECPNRKPFKSFSDLKDHLRRDHNLFYCDLCLKYLKLFSSERKPYDRQKLAEHRRVGDADDRSHKGHPLCRFCDQRYLDNDELVKHLRKDHYFCHFCEADGVTNEFYSEYHILRQHFKDEHYLCEEGECMDVEFTNAFRDDIDMRAHKANAHSKNVRRAVARQARAIEFEVNLAPRPTGSGRGSRGRGGRPDRGVVSRDDYEEVKTDDARRRGGGGGGARDRGGGGGRDGGGGGGRDGGGSRYGNNRREEAQRKREEIETAQAISASLSGKTSINVIDRSLLEPALGVAATNSDEEGKPENYERKAEDFPDLKGETKTRGTGDSSSGGSGSNMARSFARSTNFSIQEGSMAEEEFPTLGGKKATAGAPAHRPAQAWEFQPARGDFPELGGNKARPAAGNLAGHKAGPGPSWTSVKSSKPAAQKPSHHKAANPQSMKDFPSLSSIGSGLLGPKKIPGLAAPAPAHTHSTQSAKKGGWTTTASPQANKKTKKNPAPKQSQKARLYDDDDSDSPRPSAKHSKEEDYPQNAKLTKAEKFSDNVKLVKAEDLQQNVRLIRAEDIQRPAANVSNSAGFHRPSANMAEDFPTLGKPSKSKSSASSFRPTTSSPSSSSSSWGPKDKSALNEPPVTEEPFVTLSSSKSKKKKKNKKTPEIIDSDHAEDRSASPKVSPREVEPPKPARANVTGKEKENKSARGADKLMTSSVSSITDDFPTLSTLKDQSNVRPAALKLDDFPSLGGAGSPPPGFGGGAQTRKPPPGFGGGGGQASWVPPTSAAPSGGAKPPPGFSSMAADIVPEPAAVNGGAVHEFAPPPGYSERNRRLIEDIHRMTGGDDRRFSEFKTYSSQYRSGRMEAEEYYKVCSDIIGAASFSDLFPELLSLLPLIDRQQGLLRVYNSARKAAAAGAGKKGKKGGRKGWDGVTKSLHVCPTCAQVLMEADVKAHSTSHNLDSDFPALG